MTGQTKPTGLIIGLIGNLLVGYAIYSLLSGVGCVAGALTCNEAMTPAMLLLPIGIIASVIGVFLGGGIFSFTGLFLAIGVGSMAASAFNDMGEMQSFGWWFGGMFAFFGLLPLVLMKGVAASTLKKQVEAERLVKSGSRGIATITQVNDTGVTINDDPRVEIVVQIEPLNGGATVERRKKSLVPRVAIPRVGDRYPAFYDPADPSAWIMGTQMAADAPADIKDMFARAGANSADEPAPDGGLVEELERLDALRRSDALTSEEYARAKSALLDRSGR